MNTTANDKIEKFIQDTLSVDYEKAELLLSLQKTVLKTCPGAHREIKYGGLVFSSDAELICGIFIRKRHISLEFGFGNEFSDPNGYLEGSGKFRRHLKIMSVMDIKNKDVESFVIQAFDRYSELDAANT